MGLRSRQRSDKIRRRRRAVVEYALDLPLWSHSLLSATMYELLPDLKAKHFDHPEYLTYSPLNPPTPVCRWVQRAFRIFADAADHISERQRWLDAFDSIEAFGCPPLRDMPLGSHTALRSTLQSTLADATRVEVPLAGERWVLRNLTTKEVFQFEISNSTEEAVSAHVEGAPWLTLDAAFYTRTLWCWMRPEKKPAEASLVDKSVWFQDLKGGVWAGHRFDIVRRTEQSCIGTWTDATSDVVAWASENLALEELRRPVSPRRKAAADAERAQRDEKWEARISVRLREDRLEKEARMRETRMKEIPSSATDQ